MKQIFPGYNKKSKTEIKNIWDNGIICFDTNVLLNLYRYSNDTRTALLDLIEKFKTKIYLPHQSALEYNKNRYEVISDQEKTYKDFIIKLSQIENDLKSKSKPPFLSNKLHSNFKAIFTDVNSEVEDSIKKYNGFLQEDPIYDSICKIFKNKISDGFSAKELEDIYCEGEKRYENKIPPGFEDEKSKSGNRKFGDLILWKQIIEIGKREKKPILLITDERKIDWWWKIKDGRNMGPRQELIEEINKEAGVDFHMYSSERFLTFGSDYLKEQINQKALEEIKELKRAEIERFEYIKRKQLDDFKKQEDILNRNKEASFLNHKISKIREKINHLVHHIELLEESTLDESLNQDEIISSTIDLKRLKEILFDLEKKRNYLTHDKRSVDLFRKRFWDNDENN